MDFKHEPLKEGIITDESIAETLEVGPDGLFVDKKVMNRNYIQIPRKKEGENR